MPGDYTRFSFNPFEDHFGVLMQQGRVMLDADFNELVEILDRQLRVRMLDTVGPCVVPRETIDGFQIQIGGSSITIGPGRAYVDGFLAENHGAPPLEFHRRLEESRGTDPVNYEDQPYLPNAATAFPFPQDGGPFLVYLDVWRREVTYLVEPDLVEKAVGVDTATRTQTVWQVRFLDNLPDGTTCATPAEDIPAWVALTAPSAGRLTTEAVGAPSSDDPCIINPEGGYRGTENRLYRVEVHDPGAAGVATFKWSRDNASIATSVIAINVGLDELDVSSLGRDQVRRFAANDWIEVVDDHLELSSQPGVMRRIQSVDPVNERITLVAALPAGVFDAADPATRHTRIRRWDQQGQVFDSANNPVADVDASGGVIPISSGGGQMVLEDGVQVTFTEDPAGGSYRTGDYWVFAARTVDASVEIFTEAPPRGIHHHYCRLAVITFPDLVNDCRVFWPPEFGEGSCDCAECVTAESHNSGVFTIQMAIERVRGTGGKVCLGPGLFNLGTSPVELHGLQSVQLQGRGWRTVLFYLGSGGAISVSGSIGIDLEAFTVLALPFETANLALTIRNSLLVRTERTILAQVGVGDRGGPAVGVNGALIEIKLRNNILWGGHSGIRAISASVDPIGAVANISNARSYTATFGFYVEDNAIFAGARGISFEQLSFHLGQTRFTGNSIYGAREAGIVSLGFVSPVPASSRVDIAHNALSPTGYGIVAGTDNTRINENDVGGEAVRGQEGVPERHGILVFAGANRKTVDRIQILANRVVGVSGDGIRMEGPLVSAMVKNNVIERVGGGGIVMSEGSAAEQVSIANNRLSALGTRNDPQLPVSAIRVHRARQGEVSDNTIERFALASIQSPRRTGIEVVTSESVRVKGNDLVDIGPPGDFSGRCTGIEIISPFESVDVLNNSVRRSRAGEPDRGSDWVGIRIGPPVVGFVVGIFTDILFSAAVNRNVSGVFNLSTAAGGANLLLLAPAFAIALPIRSETAAARGNVVDSAGRSPAVRIQVRGVSVLDDNRASLRTGSEQGPPVADIDAAGSISGSNFLRRIPGPDSAIALDVAVGNGPATILGNICAGGQIRLNGAPLAAPWIPLNAITF